MLDARPEDEAHRLHTPMGVWADVDVGVAEVLRGTGVEEYEGIKMGDLGCRERAQDAGTRLGDRCGDGADGSIGHVFRIVP